MSTHDDEHDGMFDEGGQQWKGSMLLREKIREPGTHGVEALSHTGLTDDEDVERLLNAMKHAYSPEKAAAAANRTVDGENPYRPVDFPPTVEETRAYRMLLENQSTATLGKAIHEGDAQTQAYAVGDPGTSSNIEGLDAIQWIQELVNGPAPIIYIYGPPGWGKTNLGVLLARIWKRQQRTDDVEPLLGSNVKTLQESDRWLPSFASLEQWLEQAYDEREDGGIVTRDDAPPRLFLFDEASSDASGRGRDGHDAGRLMGPLVYKIRKANAALIVIGHDGKDVHPAMRTLATCVEKRRGELKTARFYEDVRDRQGRGHIETLTGVPRAGGYDDGEATSWSWDEQDDRSDEDALTLEEARSMAEDMTDDRVRELAVALATDPVLGAGNAEIARAVGLAHRGQPYKPTWVSKWKKRLEDDRNRTRSSEDSDRSEQKANDDA
jgi:hypothetical protein